MITLFGLTMAWWVLAAVVGGFMWLLPGFVFMVRGILEKRRKHARDSYKGGAFSKAFSHAFGIALSLVLGPVLFFLWLGERKGRKAALAGK